MDEVTRIPVDKVRPHPLNPRCNFGGINDIAESIREHGRHPFNPILVRPLRGDDGYEIINGHTRFRAMRDVLGFTELEVGRDVIVRELDDDAAFRIMVDDNIKRCQYKPAEFVEALKILKDTCGLSTEQIAEQYNVSTTWLEDILSISKLPDRVKAKVEWGKRKTGSGGTIDGPRERREDGIITVSHARQLARLGSREEQTKAALAVERFGLTGSETKRVVNAIKLSPWTAVDDIVTAIRNSVGPAPISSLTVEVRDGRVAGALNRAALAANRTPEEYAAEKVIEGLVNDGFLTAEVLKQDVYRKWMEDEILASQP